MSLRVPASATSDRAYEAAQAEADPAAPPLGLLEDVAREIGHGARVEIETLSQDTDGNWVWRPGTKTALWHERYRADVKSRARVVTDWIEVQRP